ncbi:hypothetical protein [Methanimicrococcus hacksteinii]|nr:hypothetical protein [Methanimicrococcus sp. At1]
MTGIHFSSAGFGIHLTDMRFEGIHVGGIHLNEIVTLFESESGA